MAITYKRGDADERPWGRWEVLDVGEHFIVKRIAVKPGGILSLQSHNHRSEHWIVVEGTARVTKDDEIFDLVANEHVYLPVGTKHRVANPGDVTMEFVEVQTGETLDEGDIIRYEDQYGRS